MAPHRPHHWNMFETNLSLACEFNPILSSLPMKWLNYSSFLGDGKYLLLNATTLHTTDHFALGAKWCFFLSTFLNGSLQGFILGLASLAGPWKKTCIKGMVLS